LTRQLQNIAGTPTFIADIGINILATTTYLIPPERYWYFASSSDIDTFIDAGTLKVIHNGVTLNAFDGKCLIHEGTDYMVTEVDTPSVQVVTRQTKILRLIGPIFQTTNPADGRTDLNIQLSGSAEGKEQTYQFFNNGANIKDKWLDHEGSNIPCDDTPGVIGANSKMRQITYSNARNNSNIGILVYRNGMTPGDLIFTWEIDSKQVAWKTNGLDSNTFSIGDTIRVYAEDRSGTSPTKAVVKITLVNTDNVVGEGGHASAP